MTNVVNWAGIVGGAVSAVEREPTADDFAQGGTYLAPGCEKVLVYDVVAGDDIWVGGLRLSKAGAIRAVGAAPHHYVRGLGVSASGQLCVDEDGVIAGYIAGWPVTADGRVVITEGGPVVNSFLLLESGGKLLQESGGGILLE